MPFSHLCLLIYLTPTWQPDTICPVYLHTQTVHSFKGYLFSTCLWPGCVPGMGTAVRRQTITRAEENFYQGPNAPFLWPSPLASPPSAHLPALMELQPADTVPSEHLPSSKEATLWTHCPSALAPCALCPSQSIPPSEMASPSPASTQCTW